MEKIQNRGKVKTILDEQQYIKSGHHLGRPFLTTYQIAIELNKRFPDVCAGLGLSIGGKGLGKHSSLPQYLGRELSRNIKNGALPDIEGGFLSNLHLKEFKCKSGKDKVCLVPDSYNGSLVNQRVALIKANSKKNKYSLRFTAIENRVNVQLH
jgi:hypothetical protein